MLQEIVDLRAEGDALFEVLETLDEEGWQTKTLFKDWTIHDVVLHLHHSDKMALLTATDKDAFMQMLTEMMVALGEGNGLIAFTRRWGGELTGAKLLARWRETFLEMCDCFGRLDPKTRLEWFGPDMGVRMFATARLMETWAHGQEVYDELGLERENADRIKNVVVLGVKTYGWTFMNRGMEVPGEMPYLRLEAPSGALWEWGEASEESAIVGSAVDFAQVVTQVRNIADTALEVKGDVAKQWMAQAQCFAGPPMEPPAAGTRYRRGDSA